MADRRDNPSTAEPIAIVGIGCRFPGGADSPERFWNLLVNGVDAIGDFPEGRFNIDDYYDPTPSTPGRIVTRQGGFLQDIDRFDAQFFGISPREAALMDPQQRLLLETAWEAFADAGIPIGQPTSRNTGVFVGVWTSDYEATTFDQLDDVDLYVTTGGGRYAASGRLSYAFDLRGPSMTIDTACSSSLVAVHLACRSLREGECDAALAGGVNLILQPQISVGYSRSRMLSPDARCKFGDAEANGYVRSEGCGVVVLKRLSDAVEDGDEVYAVIRGSATNNDGQGSGLLVQPAVTGQIEMLHAAYAQAGVDPGSVHYVEAHGTGTRAGDPVELEALGTVLGEGREPNQSFAVGSVKTNIGHTEAASGIAGLIKVALALRHRALPASLHFSTPNPLVPWELLPLRMHVTYGDWPEMDGPLTAAVNSFGITGTNAHVVLQEWSVDGEAPESDNIGHLPTLIPLSAGNRNALVTTVQLLAERIDGASPDLTDLAYTLGRRLTHLPERVAVVAETRDDLLERLREVVGGTPSPNVVSGRADDTAPPVVFVFPGQGSQWDGMARELIQTEPVFRSAIEEIDAAIRAETGWSVIEQLNATSSEHRLADIDVIQPVLFAIQVALAACWNAWGIAPAAVVGHSMGEVAAAHVAGALSLEDAVAVICRRSRLLRRIRGAGAMAMVDLSVDDARIWLRGLEERLSIGVSNGPRSTVLSGDPAALEIVIQRLQAANIFCRNVNVDVASHSPQVDPLLEDLRRSLDGLTPALTTVPVFSTVDVAPIDGTLLDAGYWARNLRQPVMFGATVERLLAAGMLAFVEISPHPILTPAIEQVMTNAGVDAVVVPSLRRNEPERASLLGSLGTLYTRGVDVDWCAILPAGRHLRLPAYPWQRERFWFTGTGRSRERQRANGDHGDSGNPHLGVRLPDLAHLPGSRFWQGRIVEESGDSPSAIDGVPIVPGLYAALLAGTAAEDVGGQVEDLRIVNHAVLMSPLETQTILAPLPDSDASSVQLFTRRSDDESWLLWATARVVEKPQTAEPLDLTDLQSRLALDADSEPGPMACWRSQCARLVRLNSDDDSRLSIEEVLQLVSAATFDQEGKRPSLLSRVEDAWVPSPGRLADVRWFYAQHNDGDDRGETIRLLDGAGVTIASLAGVAVEPPTPELVNRVAMTKIDDWIYNVEWRPVEIRPETPPASRHWVVLGDDTELALGLVSQLDEHGAQVQHLASIGDDPDEVERLFRDIQDTADDLPIEIVDLRSIQFDQCDFPDAVQRISTMSLALVQAIARSAQRSRTRIWFVTRGAQSVDGDVTNPAGGALWGLGRVVANELPELWGGLIDIGTDPVVQHLPALIDVISSSGPNREIGIRDGRHFVTRLTRQAIRPAERVEIVPDATYVITGGAGGIGLALARRLAAEGARHLVLIGRSQLSPHAASAVAAIEEMGVSVAYLRGDIACRDDVESIVMTLANDWPPVRGIIHTAGVLSDSTILQLTSADLQSVAAPKVAGTWNLVNEWVSSSLDFVAFCSSVSVLMGTPGQGNYAAANAALDAYASMLRSRGIPAVSIAWGRWGDVGMVNTDDRIAGLDQLGLVPVSSVAGVEAFMRVAGSSDAHVVVADIDWARYAERQVSVPPRFQDLVPNNATSGSNGHDSSGAMLARLQVVRPDDRQSSLLDHVRELTAAVLRFDGPERIYPGHGFFQMGMDSLMAVELKNRLQHSLGRTLPATLTFDYPTPTTLARWLFDDLFPEAPIDDQVAMASTIVEDVLNLPDDDVRALLDSELQLLEKELFR